MQQTTPGPKSGSEVLTIGLAQINNSFSGQNYLPYAIGLLQAYAERHAEAPEKFRFLLPVYKRIKVDDAVAQLRDADAVGFSLYVWNERLTLEVARDAGFANVVHRERVRVAPVRDFTARATIRSRAALMPLTKGIGDESAKFSSAGAASWAKREAAYLEWRMMISSKSSTPHRLRFWQTARR